MLEIDTLNNLLSKSVATMCLLLMSIACAPSKDDPASQQAVNYAIYTINKDHSSGFLLLDSLSPKASMRQISNPTVGFNREFIQKGGYFYQQNNRSGHLVQYEVSTAGTFVAIDSIALGKVNIENYLWKNQSDTLLLFTVDQPNVGVSRIYTIKTKRLQVIREATLPFPTAVDDYSLINIGVVDLRADKLWLAYSYSKYVGSNDYTTSPTMYYATLNLETLAPLEQQEDQRSTYPGGISTVQSYQAKNEQGDLYFMSCPGIALGNTEGAPTALFRKVAGSDEVDTHYMIDISAKLGNHAYGFWYVGKQKAIIRSEQKDKYTDFADHHSTYQFEYYLVDLDSGDLEKINIPLDKGTRKETVLIEAGIAYIAIDDKDDQHSLWAFDPSSKQTKLIRQFGKDIDFILRLDKLK